MLIAITHFYCQDETDAWGDIIDTNLLPEAIETILVDAINAGEESVELDYSVMQNNLTSASIDTFPCTIEGVLTVYEKG